MGKGIERCGDFSYLKVHLECEKLYGILEIEFYIDD